MAKKISLPANIRPYVADCVQDKSSVLTPKEAASKGLELWKEGASKSVQLLNEAEEYANYLISRSDSNGNGRILNTGVQIGSETRLAFICWFSMRISAARQNLFDTENVPFEICDPLNEKDIAEQLKKFELWLLDSPQLDLGSKERNFEWMNRLWTFPKNSLDSKSATFAPATKRGFEVARTVWSLQNEVHYHEWSPFLPYGESGLSWCSAFEFTLWLIFGIYPCPPLAWVTVAEKSISEHGVIKPKREVRQLGFPGRGFGARGITIHIFDPDGTSPDAIRELYSDALQYGLFSKGKPYTRTREVLSILELEYILEKLRREIILGNVIDINIWVWRPKPKQLFDTWKIRANGFGLDQKELDSSSAIHAFQKRRGYEVYRVAIQAEASRYVKVS